AAVQMIRQTQRLRDLFRNDPGDPPVMDVTSIVELESGERIECREPGFVWYEERPRRWWQFWRWSAARGTSPCEVIPMGNEANLVANNSPRPVGIPPDEEPTYEDEDCLAYAKWTIPILWVSLFVEDDLKFFESIEGDCLAPVTSLRKARLNWSR